MEIVGFWLLIHLMLHISGSSFETLTHYQIEDWIRALYVDRTFIQIFMDETKIELIISYCTLFSDLLFLLYSGSPLPEEIIECGPNVLFVEINTNVMSNVSVRAYIMSPLFSKSQSAAQDSGCRTTSLLSSHKLQIYYKYILIILSLWALRITGMSGDRKQLPTALGCISLVPLCDSPHDAVYASLPFYLRQLPLDCITRKLPS